MRANTILDDVLNNIINHYEDQLVHAVEAWEKCKLEKERNKEIVKCLQPVAYPGADAAAILARHKELDGLYSGMSPYAIQVAADAMARDVREGTKLMQVLILIANLAARLNEPFAVARPKEGGS